MKYAVIGIMVLCLSGGALASSRALSASAFSSATSISSSDAGSTVKSLVAKAFAQARADGSNTHAIAEATAVEVGKVYATALAQVSGVVYVEGTGQAVSEASSEAEDQAFIVAKAISDAVAEATNYNTAALSKVNVEETKVAIARAVAKVDIRLTTTGGFAEGTSTSISKAVATVTARAIAGALAYNVGDSSNSSARVNADVTVDDQSKSKTGTSVTVGGDGDANAWSESQAFVKALEWCWEAKPCCDGHFLGENGQKCMWDNNKGRWTYKSSWHSGIQVWTDIGNGSKACRC